MPWTLRASESRRFWQVLLVAAGGVMSVTLGCIVPFPAMAALASRTLSRRAGAIALFGAVAANQAVGFLILGYPHTGGTIAWVPVFALATWVAFEVSRRISQPLVALLSSFVAYEACLGAYTFATEHSLAAFAPYIVATVALGNAIGLAVLLPTYGGVVAIERLTHARGADVVRSS